MSAPLSHYVRAGGQMGSGLKRDLVRPGGIRSGSSVPGVVYPYTVYISRGCTNNLLQPVAHIASIQYLV